MLRAGACAVRKRVSAAESPGLFSVPGFCVQEAEGIFSPAVRTVEASRTAGEDVSEKLPPDAAMADNFRKPNFTV